MRYLIVALCLLFVEQNIYSNTIVLDPNNKSHSLEWARPNIEPGDTVYLMPGNHQTNQYISNLHGTADKPIYIIGDEKEPTVFQGGSQAVHLSDVSYIHIKNIHFTGQTANGMNIDDGGSYETPTHHIVFENCLWYDIAASGNNDLLKMSGVDNFNIRNCVFRNGSEGGSLIDMVGCHEGIIESCEFIRGGSNSIQAKGGTSQIIIRQNHFSDGGQRSINCGGSTGLPYFRPIDAEYEAADIDIYSNIFHGSTAPIAFVGSINCRFVNNSIFNPSRWTARILQENTNERFVQCSYNTFANNICVFTNDADHEGGINIGSNTMPETFIFTNNLWYNSDNDNWNGPNQILSHQNTIVNEDPIFKTEVGEIYYLDINSPAIGSGFFIVDIFTDFYGSRMNDPRDIGAVTYQGNTSVEFSDVIELYLYPNPASDYINIETELWSDGRAYISIVDIMGNEVMKFNFNAQVGELKFPIDVSHLANGTYFLAVKLNDKEKRLKFVINK